MEILRNLGCFILIIVLLSFFWSKTNRKLKEEKLEEKIRDWWDSSTDEEDFLKKFEIFLKIYPTHRGKKTRIYLKKIQEILQKQYLREEKISCEIYEKLLDLIEERGKNLLSH